jgi:gas vesicle protein
MSSSKILVGFLAGAAVGALAGILFAPDKGSNTRKKIATKTGDVTDSVKSSFGDFIDTVKHTYSGVKEDAEEFGNKTKSKLDGLKNDGKTILNS